MSHLFYGLITDLMKLSRKKKEFFYFYNFAMKFYRKQILRTKNLYVKKINTKFTYLDLEQKKLLKYKQSF